MRSNAPRESTERWLNEGFSLRTILALDMFERGGENSYLQKVCEVLDIEDSYYCAGYEVEQLMIKSINRIGAFTGTGKNVIELRGLPGSGCSTLSVLCGHMLRYSVQQPEDAKDTFDGIAWPKVLYIGLRVPGSSVGAPWPSPRRCSRSGLEVDKLEDIISECVQWWFGWNLVQLTNAIKRWFLYHAEDELFLVIDNAETLCKNWKVTQQIMAPWMSMNRLNLLLVNQSSDIFRPLNSAKRCVVRVSCLEPEHVFTILNNTRAKRHGGDTSASLKGSAVGEAPPGDDDEESVPTECHRSPISGYVGKSVMEILVQEFMDIADQDEVFAANLVVRWVMTLTGGLPKRIKTLCDTTIANLNSQQKFDPHDLAVQLLKYHGAPLILDFSEEMLTSLANITIAAQVQTYGKMSELLEKGPASSASTSSLLKPSGGETSAPPILQWRFSATSVSTTTPPMPPPSFSMSEDVFSVLLKLVSLQKGPSPIDDRVNKTLKERSAISYDDDCLVKREWYLKNQMRVVCCGPELCTNPPDVGVTTAVKSNSGTRVSNLFYRSSPTHSPVVSRPSYKELITFSPFMLYTHHEDLNRIARSYIRFCATRSYHKGIFNWLSFRFILIPAFLNPNFPIKSIYKQAIEPALIAGLHSWLDRPVWTNLIFLMYRIFTRHSSVWEYARFKRLAIYSGFKVPRNKTKRSTIDSTFTWLKFDSPVYQLFSKSCHRINAAQYSEIIQHSHQSAQKGIITIIVESFTNHIVVISPSFACIYDVNEDVQVLSKRLQVMQAKSATAQACTQIFCNVGTTYNTHMRLFNLILCVSSQLGIPRRSNNLITFNAIPTLFSDILLPRRFWKAIARFSIFDAEGQRRSIRAGGLSALLSQLWLPSHMQRALFPDDHFMDFLQNLKTVERNVHLIVANTVRTPPPLLNFNEKRSFGQPFNFSTLLNPHYPPLLP